MQILMPRSVRAVARHRGKAEPKADLESKFLITSGGSRKSWAATVSKRVGKDHRSEAQKICHSSLHQELQGRPNEGNSKLKLRKLKTRTESTPAEAEWKECRRLLELNFALDRSEERKDRKSGLKHRKKQRESAAGGTCCKPGA